MNNSPEEKINRPFWWHHRYDSTDNGKSSKEEIEDKNEDEDEDESVKLSMKLMNIPTEKSKDACLGTLLYPKIKKPYTNQVNKLYNICLESNIQELQSAICDNNLLDELVTIAQTVLGQCLRRL